ncbi:MAG TPA: CBS domain-containing protein [Labilithrix sp.]|nr:CBS domain-containing protein [Labilithrix sp.]
MTTSLVVLDVRMTVDVAAGILAERRISGAPVVSAAGKPVGIVSRADLLDPRHRVPGASVESAMTRMLYAVRPTDPATTAIRLMVAENIHRVVAVDTHGALVGIVTSMDVMRAIAGSEPGAGDIEYIKLGS